MGMPGESGLDGVLHETPLTACAAVSAKKTNGELRFPASKQVLLRLLLLAGSAQRQSYSACPPTLRTAKALNINTAIPPAATE
jgi:hypothetical protein